MPVHTDEDSCPLDTRPYPQPTLLLQKCPGSGVEGPLVIEDLRPQSDRRPTLVFPCRWDIKTVVLCRGV